MNTGDTTRHIASGDLVRLLHGELDRAERDAVVVHLDGCRRCEERRVELESRLADARASLAQLSAPPLDPARRAQAWAEIQRAQLRRRKATGARRWNQVARAAAVAAVMVTAAFSVEPVRAWVAQAWNLLAGEPATAVREEAPSPVRIRNAVVGFVPESAEFVVELRNRQEIGSLAINVIEEVTTASARLSGPDEVEVAVLPGGFRIENGAGDASDYEVTIPATVERITIRIGEASPLQLNRAQLDLPWRGTIDLQTGTFAPVNNPDIR